MEEPGETESAAKERYIAQVKEACARIVAALQHFSAESESATADKESVSQSLQGLQDTALWYIDNVEKEKTCRELKIAASNTISKLEYLIGIPLPDASSPRPWSLCLLDLEEFNRRFKEVDWQPAHRPPRAPPRLFISKLHSTQDRVLSSQGLKQWIDVAHLRRWMSQCQKHHPSHCNLSTKSKALFHYKPQWLIDVRRGCLVKADTHARYMALSYVWGSSMPFRTCRQNVAQLQEANSLAAASKLGISPTVSHAIQLTKRLGESHLWVDTLCIIQDDDANKREHLDNMGSIYANAFASIVATSGTAEDGLYGLQSVTPPSKPLLRDLDPRDHENPDAMPQRMAHASLRRAHQTLMKSAWSSRGWTFQEQIFSRRLLVMSDSSVIWECHCSVWFEGDTADGTELCTAETEVVAEGFYFSINPKFKEYKLHAIRVNRSILTFPEDIMDSFAGVLTVLNSVFKGGFWCCLPVMFLHDALLWYGQTPLKRRQASKPGVRMPPTWSWAAWEGDIDFPREDDVRPLVNWKYCGPESEGEWRDAQSCSAAGDSKTQHNSTPARASHRPLLSTEADPPVLGSGEQYLIYARAERNYFGAAAHGNQSVFLEDKAGNCIGTITSNVAVEVSKHKEPQCEVVAISKTTIGTVTTYNVLWIERDDFGIAYRKGVGRILASDWEAQNPEEIVLMLG